MTKEFNLFFFSINEVLKDVTESSQVLLFGLDLFGLACQIRKRKVSNPIVDIFPFQVFLGMSPPPSTLLVTLLSSRLLLECSYYLCLCYLTNFLYQSYKVFHISPKFIVIFFTAAARTLSPTSVMIL